MNFNITAGKKRCQFPGKHVSVGTGNVQVDIFLNEQAVYRFLILMHILNFIKKNIVHFCGQQLCLDIIMKRVRIKQVTVIRIFKINLNYLLRPYPVSKQAAAVQFQ